MRRLLLAGVLFHLLAAWLSVGFYHPDEHFQILELAGLKLGIDRPSDLPWEYAAEIRSAFQPALAYALISAAKVLGVTDPFDQTLLLRVLSGALSLMASLLLVREYILRIDSLRAARWMLGLSLLLAFLPFFHVRFSSETWASAFMVLGLVVVKQTGGGRLSAGKALLMGVLFGLAFLCRYQIALMVVGVLGWLWVIRREPVRALLPVLLGGLAVLSLGALLDHWLYGHWVFSPWRYLNVNLLGGTAATFGTLPWWGYFELLVEPPGALFGVLIILTFFVFFVLYPRSLLTWASVPFLLTHMLIGHKELRFLLPLASFIGIFVVRVITALDRRGFWPAAGTTRDRLIKWSGIAFLTVNIPALLFMSVRPATFRMIPLIDVLRIKGDQPAVLLYPKGQESPLHIKGHQPAVPLYPKGQTTPLAGELKLNFYRPADLTEQPLDRLEDLPRYVRARGRYLLFILPKHLADIRPIQAGGVSCTIVERPPDWVVKHLDFVDLVNRFWIGVLYNCQPSLQGPRQQVGGADGPVSKGDYETDPGASG